jgi:hypothetical protein
MFVKPAEGRTVRRPPPSKQLLPATGAEVNLQADGFYFARRLRDGDVVEATPPAVETAPAAGTAAPASAATSPEATPTAIQAAEAALETSVHNLAAAEAASEKGNAP